MGRRRGVQEHMTEKAGKKDVEGTIFASGYFGGRGDRGDGGAALRVDHHRTEDEGARTAGGGLCPCAEGGLLKLRDGLHGTGAAFPGRGARG